MKQTGNIWKTHAIFARVHTNARSFVRKFWVLGRLRFGCWNLDPIVDPKVGWPTSLLIPATSKHRDFHLISLLVRVCCTVSYIYIYIYFLILILKLIFVVAHKGSRTPNRITWGPPESLSPNTQLPVHEHQVFYGWPQRESRKSQSGLPKPSTGLPSAAHWRIHRCLDRTGYSCP